MKPPVRAPRRVLTDIFEEHLHEAAFLFGRWKAGCCSPRSSLRQVAEGPEARLWAHFDGLAYAGADAVGPLLGSLIESVDEGDVFVAAIALLEIPSVSLNRLAPLLTREPDEGTASVAAALRLARNPRLPDLLRSLLMQGAPPWKAAAANALRVRGVDLTAAIPHLQKSASPEVKAEGLRAIRVTDGPLRTWIEYALDAPEAPVREAAFETGLALALPTTLPAARRWAATRTPEAAPALIVLAIAGDASDVPLLAAAVDVPALQAAAFCALGFSGWPQAAEACLRHLADRKTAALAGEAFARVTGLALEGAFALPVEEEEDGLVPLEEEDWEVSLVPGPEAELALPDAARVAAWWKAEAGRFSTKARYHRGLPYSLDVLWNALAGGPMRDREALALELSARTRGAVRLHTQGWARHQRDAISAARGRG